MQRVTALSTFENMVIFSKEIELLKRTIVLLKGSCCGFTFIVLEIDGVKLKVEENSSIEDLMEELDERKTLLAKGKESLLNQYYRELGLQG